MTPLQLTIKDAAKLLGFDREVVAGMCRRGELPFTPCLTPDGKRSRVHKRIPVSGIEAWIKRNTIKSAADFKAALDGRKKA